MSEEKNTELVLEGVPPKRSWKRGLLLAVGYLFAVGVTAGVLTVAGVYYYFSADLPEIPKVDQYWPPIVTEVFTDDAVLAGEFYAERRKVVPYERIPKRLVQAFIASEDASFFDHFGVDVLGTTRAVFKTLRKKAGMGGSTQGGSTLTQQTAKAVLISAEGYEAATERSGMAGIRRKIREALLAMRLERALTKEEILYLYLNNVYLGHHSYGVQSAAENYFRKDVRDLTLAEMSLIAGLPQAPSRFSPFRNPEAAKTRRRYVLRRMFEEGMISKDERADAEASEVSVYPVEDVFHEFAPYFTEHVRKKVVERYGNPALLEQGLKIFTTMDAERQRAAQEAVLQQLLAVDKRQGFRGPLMNLARKEERAAFVDKSIKVLGEEPLQLGTLYVALVTGLDKDFKTAHLQLGPHKGLLPILGARWARPVNVEQRYPDALLDSLKKVVKVGDVILVRHVEQKDLADDKEAYEEKLDKAIPKDVPLFRLEQEPELQAAMVSIDPWRQYVVAMVGGYDFDANEYNRAFQACRQPGSAFKPFVYAAAVDQLNWTQATILVDSPIVTHSDDTGVVWKPGNFTDEFEGDMLLRRALTESKNLPAIKTFGSVGVRKMESWSRAFGFSTPMNLDFSAALGSSCVYPYELAEGYATLARYGLRKEAAYLRKIEDRFGRTIEDHTAVDDAWAPLLDRLAAGYANLFDRGEQVIQPESGFIMVDLLRGVVKEGTGGPANRLGKPAAGKTGTTNDSYDTWFAGFTRDLVTVSWMGYDLNAHPLGRYETGGRASLPMWIEYMKDALAARPQPEFDEPPPELVENLVKLKIDPKTGKLAAENGRAVELWFKKGTEPLEAEAGKDEVRPEDIGITEIPD